MPELFTRILRVSGWLLVLFIGLLPFTAISESINNAPPLSLQKSRLVPAYEHILSFDSRARFNPDGSMEMQENIKVLALGKTIRRGIFRTLPLTWNRQDGKIFTVNYAIKSVLLNGVAEPYSTDPSAKTLIVRIGSAERVLKPGIYNYEIRYQVSNHFSRFPGWDELYWNVTGNDWAWPVSKASFHLELPDAASHLNAEGKDARLRSIDVYTGARGEKGHNALIFPDGDVRTSRALAEGEGLTVVYTWPRDILASAPAPKAVQPLIHLLLPTPETSVIWLPLLLMVFYYGYWWRKNVTATGLKMPPVIPLFALPETMSPGYLRYLTQRKYDDVAFSSDLLGLVAKRAAKLTKKSKSGKKWSSSSADELWLSRLPDEENPRLNADDKTLSEMIFSGRRKNIDLNKAHQRPLIKARKWLTKHHEEQHMHLFRPWSKPLLYCIAIALLIPVVCGVWFSPLAAVLAVPGLLFLLIGLPLVIFLVKFLCSPLKTLRAWGGVPVFLALIFGPFATFGAGAFITGASPITQLPAGYIGAWLAAIVLCTIIGWKTPRYTQRGLNELAVAKGLKRYLKTAEKHRYQVLYPPEQMIAHFESLLPVALALDTGKTWANTFANYLASTGAISEVFENADWGNVHHFSQACHSASEEKSSSTGGGSSDSGSSGSGSSGGGSSGGGSGGGGGGGW